MPAPGILMHIQNQSEIKQIKSIGKKKQNDKKYIKITKNNVNETEYGQK